MITSENIISHSSPYKLKLTRVDTRCYACVLRDDCPNMAFEDKDCDVDHAYSLVHEITDIVLPIGQVIKMYQNHKDKHNVRT